MIPIAHRGFWFANDQIQNSLLAISEAFTNGWAAEIDVVMHGDGEFTLSHETAFKGLSLHTILKHIASDHNGPTPRLFINIKQPHVETELIALLRLHHAEHLSCIFDYELAGDKELGARARRQSAAITILARASDRPGEKLNDVLNREHVDGVWMDTFDQQWITEAEIALTQKCNRKAYVVSPELHNQVLPMALWCEWKWADGICTDFPHLLSELADPLYKKDAVGELQLAGTGKALFPDNPWW